MGALHRAAAGALPGAVVLTAAGWLLASPASAHHPDVDLAVRCDAVEVRVYAWPGTPDDPATPVDELTGSRTSGGSEVTMSVDGGPYEPVPQEAGWRLDPPAFEQVVDVPLPERARTVSVRAVTVEPWANGAAPGDERVTDAVPVPPCGAPAVRVTDTALEPASNPRLPPLPPVVEPDPAGAWALPGLPGRPAWSLPPAWCGTCAVADGPAPLTRHSSRSGHTASTTAAVASRTRPPGRRSATAVSASRTARSRPVSRAAHGNSVPSSAVPAATTGHPGPGSGTSSRPTTTTDQPATATTARRSGRLGAATAGASTG